ncbi:hypothetical protein HBH56_016670 [Parastagonospora nodorum]|uniref:BTB domain-containing protein n=2 Tax=Phaeosphaeria nodorum (strain SN15 / ATCC MYA-4574 / FGSC 10173) TaxID=321614 RepID=A0A7U2EYL3_PHANO|nr:hypothetical protein SNOG_02846 [Parastagonospora nodorum SN15]KAH3919619.1 hypothetical protein HBH56_016670 [Parastagonospora nodorum]EAT89577.1 hypothetical protein SNOG_02846 [Parastagonospora nodorum SN15]KAH3936955.1 hypothetical protein HBH54_017790 [Parastagonospora nodorum]KAH4134382.1 hypothetical protein HBH45_165360 [Parastagonospora nodorum]KAH4173256.1 hypothetical protein HBH44_018260 [Parastagonospora nodorum]
MAQKRKHDDFLADLKSLLDTGKFSDFTITCQGREWKVHKAIVCSQSDTIEAASRFGKEAEEAKIDLTEDDPEIVEYMLRFMYERNYRLPSDDVPGPHWVDFGFENVAKSSSIMYRKTLRGFEVALYEHSSEAMKTLREKFPGLLEKYQGKVLRIGRSVRLLKLKRDVVEIVNGYCDEKSETYRQPSSPPTGDKDLNIHAKIYALADRYFVKGLKALACEKFEECLEVSFAAKSFYEAINIVFTTTPDTDTGLRDLAVKRVSEEKRKYCLDADPDLRKALKEIPDLAYTVLSYEDMRGQNAEPAEEV